MRPSYDQQVKEFEEKVIQVNRVSKKTKGGNRISFAVLMAIGDRKGRVGVGLGKAAEVPSAVQKATSRAKKNIITVVSGGSIPHSVLVK
jgi:small subunit ribosomal protein S5